MSDQPHVKTAKDGPYLIAGPLSVTDASGKATEFPAGKTAALCRCGHSKNKPFCDGSHKAAGFTDPA